jgi:hypothetical protein
MSHNSSNAFDRPLLVELAPSPVMLRAAYGAYLAAALLCLTGLAPTLLLVPLGAHFVWLHGVHLKTWLPGAVSAVSWDSERGWRLRFARGHWVAAKLAVPVFVSRHLTAVRFRCAGFRRRAVLVTWDRCDADDFRRLRVRLIESAHGGGDRAKVSGA